MKPGAIVLACLLASACDQGTEPDLTQTCACTAEIQTAMEQALDTATTMDQTVKSEVERQLFERAAYLESVVVELRARVDALESR